jgi:hypothetical protein
MKKDASPKMLQGSISLIVNPEDAIAWKLAMLYEAASSKEKNIEDLAKNMAIPENIFTS